jgi:predicted dehydrogenase
MVNKLRWGVLSTAKIGREKVIPAMQKSRTGEVVALASRDLQLAQATTSALGIPKAYGSYEELLADPEIDAIYNPLPNHLHVPLTIDAASAGKHVLCEKPIALTAKEAAQLLDVQHETGVLITEAFMVRDNPQWHWVRDRVQDGTLGRLVAVQACFSYTNRDAENIRNIPEFGGGGIYDIGCYPVVVSRLLFGEEPEAVAAIVEDDPEFKTDRLASVLMRFPSGGQASFVCSTQMVPYQRVQVYGTKRRIEVEIPFNSPNQMPCRVFLDEGESTHDRFRTITDLPIVDQYTCQAETFEARVREGDIDDGPVQDAVANMRVLDALYCARKSGSWESVA